MNITKQHHEQQEAKQLQDRISSFLRDFQVGTLLNKCGIRKLRGASALAMEQRCHDYQKTIGGLFFACCDEIKDLSLIEALQRLLALALDKVRASTEVGEATVIAMIGAIMGVAIEFIQTSKQLCLRKTVYSTI